MKDHHHIYIKNMVCPRCVSSVTNVLEGANIEYHSVSLGKVVLAGPPNDQQLSYLKEALSIQGFEILESNEEKMVNTIKSYLITRIENKEMNQSSNLSEQLSKLLMMDYSTISRTFALTEGTTIERYAMTLKVEKVKELLSYGEQTVSEIAFQLGYSSTAHLSGQFRKITGLSPSEFRKLHRKPRRFLSDF